jgi:1,4-alpha-glucan branching enzyme
VIRRAPAKSGDLVRVTFALPVESTPDAVSVVGDFNAWTPGRHTLKKRSNGTRSVSIALEPGSTTRFRYLADGGHWFDDTDADALDPQGGLLSL